MIKNQRDAVLFGLAAVLLWSTVATAFKLALAELRPVQLVFYASLFSWLFLGLFLLVTGRMAEVLPCLKRNPQIYLKLGLINPFLYYLILFQAYDLLPAQQAQALNYTWAIMLSLLAVPFLGQRLRRQDIIALILAYFGVLVICTRGDLTQLEFDSPLGVALAIASTLLWALYWIFNTRNQDPPVVGLFICFSISLPLIALTLSWQQAWLIPSLQALGLALYVGLFEMGITFVLWLMAMKKAENTAAVSNLIFISPFLSLIFIQQFLGEEIHQATLLGLVLIILGLLVQRLKKRPA
ncbi:DMT family transporter [Neptuniibacter halophilus]|uniref:DMT family transporter n=1 Tax=Neptuniibacter halophilus TaxID=651666 RepID=UPI0025737363|nr:DMT family transporter [Neptuniibacter halophilus]